MELAGELVHGIERVDGRDDPPGGRRPVERQRVLRHVRAIIMGRQPGLAQNDADSERLSASMTALVTARRLSVSGRAVAAGGDLLPCVRCHASDWGGWALTGI